MFFYNTIRATHISIELKLNVLTKLDVAIVIGINCGNMLTKYQIQANYRLQNLFALLGDVKL